METKWSKDELVTYLLIFCAMTDHQEHRKEYQYIKTKTDPNVFEKMYGEIQNDSEDTAMEKIAETIHKYEFSHAELVTLRQDIHKVFFADGQFAKLEQNMVRILDNIIY